MNEVDLKDLKIRHEPIVAQRKPRLLLGLALFLAGVVVGYLGYELLINGSFLAGSASPATATEGETSSWKAGSTKAGNEVVSPTTPRTPEQQSFTEGGWIEVPSYHPIVVSSLVPGRLEELHVLEGQHVAQEEVIGRLYTIDLEDELDRAKAELAVASAQLERLRAGFRVQEVAKAAADLEAMEADVALRERVVTRTRELLETGAVSLEDLDRDEAAYREAKARTEALRQEYLLKREGSRIEDVQAAEAEVERRSVLVELARNHLSYTEIRSPVDGVVLERFVTPGTYIPTNNPRIVSLYDPGDLQVRVDVRQENIGSVSLGQEVEVFTDVEPGRTYAGTVIRLEPLADFKKNTIQVKVKIKAPSRNLYPEMIARIRFSKSTEREEENHDDEQADGANR